MTAMDGRIASKKSLTAGVYTRLIKVFCEMIFTIFPYNNSNGLVLQNKSMKEKNFSDPEEHFMLLQVIETYLTVRYADNDQDHDIIRRWMRGWLQHL